MANKASTMPLTTRASHETGEGVDFNLVDEVGDSSCTDGTLTLKGHRYLPDSAIADFNTLKGGGLESRLPGSPIGLLVTA